MAWSRRTQAGGVEPVNRPEAIDPDSYEKMPEQPADLQDLNESVSVAKAKELPGSPSTMIPSISLANYTPPEGAITSVLGSHGY